MASGLLESLPVPTIDRPFGVELWPAFDKAFSSVMGYSPQDFRFVQGQTPMSTFPATVAMIVSYYAVVLGGRELMRDRKPMKLNALFQIHNVYLTVISGTLLALFMEQLIPTVWRHGTFYAICHRDGGWTKELVILYYLNYLTKYLELIDTVFLVLKKKPLTTALLCYTQLIGLTSVSWVPITLNLLVHVVMYWYYFLSSRGIRVWWKEWITRLQIAQFIIDLGFVYFASYTYFVSTYWPWLPSAGRCAGEEFAAFSGMGILSSYLLLFISFYLATYKKSGKGRKPVATQAAKALGNGNGYSNGVLKANGTANGTANGHANGHTNGYANGTANGAANATGRGRSPNGVATRSRKA
ncbi:MAG: hypothetical protein M1839_003930 [Geoglossum umbratile]|nr:MAG: hypothetical protein M1839_003930 [Geoglossum umbratile]